MPIAKIAALMFLSKTDVSRISTEYHTLHQTVTLRQGKKKFYDVVSLRTLKNYIDQHQEQVVTY